MKKLLLSFVLFIFSGCTTFFVLNFFQCENLFYSNNEVLYDNTVKPDDKATISAVLSDITFVPQADAKIYIIEKTAPTCLQDALLYNVVPSDSGTTYRYIVVGSENPSELLDVLRQHFSQYDEKNCDQ